MAENNDEAEDAAGVEATGTATPPGGDPMAAAMALHGASRDKADTFLDNQSALIGDQRHYVRERYKQLVEQVEETRLRVWSLRLGLLLKMATVVVGITFAAGAGFMVWEAAHSKGLVIAPFSVPPDLAGHGLTGEVMAGQMLDRLATMTARESSRAAQSYANNWGNDIKVEIPDTGVSIGELQRFLKEWLGHDIRISGEVYRTGTGIAVTARVDSDAGATFEGSETDLKALMQKAAEHVYETTQPYRYANYLDRDYSPAGLQDRVQRADAIYRKLVAGDDPVERAWAWNGLGTLAWNFHNDEFTALAYYRKAIAATPDFIIAHFALASRESSVQEEDGLAHFRIADTLLNRSSIPDLNPHYIPYVRLSAKIRIAVLTGDYGAAIAASKIAADLPDDFSVLSRNTFTMGALQIMTDRHDLGAVRAYLRDLGLRAIPEKAYATRAEVAIEQQNWKAVAALESLARRVPGSSLSRYALMRPRYALAMASLRDFAGAEKLMAPMPGDYDSGIRVRAQIAEMQGQHGRADWWFARSEKNTPSIPFTDALWGQALLGRGQPDAAIEKFKLSHRTGPHFADSLEGWGEALMAKNQSHLALAKFAEAEKYAPNWGRLHLKWGEALAYVGKGDEAKAQFARAAGLDLTSTEKFELARHS